ncbi:PepSY domain-containing protein [Thalassotalea aquiviva]|uniref:PepSY domain-containing protein n=1 Tax=Thalassotalea aquiviva TaxID=3242415 RepID=UPI003529F87F
MKRFSFLLILLLTLPCSGLSMAYAPKSADKNAPRLVKKQNSEQAYVVKSPSQAAKIVKARFGGKVLSSKKKKSGYRVKLLKDNGKIITVQVDAKTGKIKG